MKQSNVERLEKIYGNILDCVGNLEFLEENVNEGCLRPEEISENVKSIRQILDGELSELFRFINERK